MSEHRSGFSAALDEMAQATDRLLATVDQLDERALREPSLLPTWTRAHVLTHVARNADGMVNLVRWAVTGQPTEMYAGGREGRNADIEAGADRHIGDVRLDLNDSGEHLLAAFADFSVEALEREVRLSSGAAAYGWELPLLRTREVEIHHVDLNAGYSPAHWSAAFTERTLDQLSPFFAEQRHCPVAALHATDTGKRWRVGATGPSLSGPATALLAWLTGRSFGDGLDLDPPGDVPRAPVWR